LQFARASVGSGGRVDALLFPQPSDFFPTRRGYIPNFMTVWADLQCEFERDEICVDVLANIPSANSIDLTALHRFVDPLCVIDVCDHYGLNVRITVFLGVVPVVIEFIFSLCSSVDGSSRSH
jgi:hypothetical protein